MIEFEGKVSKSVTKHIMRKFLMVGIIVDIIVLLLGVSFFVSIGMNWVVSLIISFSSASISIVISVCSVKEALPLRICIEDDQTISGTYANGYGTRKLDQVKKVIDYGDFYDITFVLLYRWRNCVCQKDLITQGTIEEFEQLFEDKIVRKVK